jgi:hypothetical protein
VIRPVEPNSLLLDVDSVLEQAAPGLAKLTDSLDRTRACIKGMLAEFIKKDRGS